MGNLSKVLALAAFFSVMFGNLTLAQTVINGTSCYVVEIEGDSADMPFSSTVETSLSNTGMKIVGYMSPEERDISIKAWSEFNDTGSFMFLDDGFTVKKQHRGFFNWDVGSRSITVTQVSWTKKGETPKTEVLFTGTLDKCRRVETDASSLILHYYKPRCDRQMAKGIEAAVKCVPGNPVN